MRSAFNFAVRLWKAQKEAREEGRDIVLASDGYEALVEHTDAGLETTARDSAGQELRSVHFTVTDDQPEAYPAGLPFLSGVPAKVLLEGDQWKELTWSPLDDLDGTFDRVAEELQREGWATRGEPTDLFGAGRAQRLEKGADTVTLRTSTGRNALVMIRKSES